MAKGKHTDSIGDVVDGLEDIAEKQDKVAIDDLLDKFGDRSFAPLMLILALVGISPVGGIPSVPTIIALCIAIIAAQMAWGRKHVWLPGFVTGRGVSSDRLTKGEDKLRKIADVLDSIAKGRLKSLASGPARRVVAGLIVVLCLALPVLEIVPFAAAAPFLAIAMLSLALMVRDGLVLLIGGAVALAALGYGVYWFAA
ncbi:MAG: exopolysaccharide biosynthesis protein [Erythrobacter sp.]|uniref:exopolysaccharide biosynthesis protein n=1 Tax=Erythrobacter sp. TaxID=1042 RepID=UPI0025D4938F|nr:exopolysaccharide biosynthesis protein [Erythrobacter sp.]MCM0000314.1 exopolysaccharide biosynthesis protein [Erythrobacter sp.]